MEDLLHEGEVAGHGGEGEEVDLVVAVGLELDEGGQGVDEVGDIVLAGVHEHGQAAGGVAFLERDG